MAPLVIGFDSGAPSEVAPKGYGIFVPYGDSQALEETVLSYCEDRSLLQPAEQCVAFARERYADTVMADRFEAIYAALINGAARAVAEDMEGYYRVPPDLRDLNYAKYFEKGERRITEAVDYNSHNTHRLDVEGMNDLLLKLRFVQAILCGESVATEE